MRIPPTTTAASAMLKIGHHWTSIQSTTAPDRKPAWARKMRSNRLPKAPPITTPISTSAAVERTLRASSTRATTIARTTREIHRPAPDPVENAIPVFSA